MARATNFDLKYNPEYTAKQKKIAIQGITPV
jgi:hypothetical protein